MIQNREIKLLLIKNLKINIYRNIVKYKLVMFLFWYSYIELIQLFFKKSLVLTIVLKDEFIKIIIKIRFLSQARTEIAS